jgi:hypothetical protein
MRGHASVIVQSGANHPGIDFGSMLHLTKFLNSAPADQGKARCSSSDPFCPVPILDPEYWIRRDASSGATQFAESDRTFFSTEDVIDHRNMNIDLSGAACRPRRATEFGSKDDQKPRSRRKRPICPLPKNRRSKRSDKVPDKGWINPLVSPRSLTPSERLSVLSFGKPK